MAIRKDLVVIVALFLGLLTALTYTESAFAGYIDDQGIIDSHFVSVLNSQTIGRQYYGAQIEGTFSSWYYFSRWASSRWIEFYNSVITVVAGGWVDITFPSDVVISYWSANFKSGLGSISKTYGGTGSCYLKIYMIGLADWTLYLETNEVPRKYWGSTVPIRVDAVADNNFAFPTIETFNLKI